MDKLKHKIKMLLAKAAYTPYPAEAETFQRAAEKLMAKHGIEVSLSGADEVKHSEPHRIDLTFSGVYAEAIVTGTGFVVHKWPPLAGMLSSVHGSTVKVLSVFGDEETLANSLTTPSPIGSEPAPISCR